LGRRFHKANRSQLHLLPISINQWVEEIFFGIVWSILIWGSFARPMGMGAPCLMIQMMLATLLYA
jgi:hypothetical protein